MPVYEIINMFDPYTIEGDELVCCVATILFSEGAYGLETEDGETVLPLLAFGGTDMLRNWLASKGIDYDRDGLTVWAREHATEIAEALEGVLLGYRADRKRHQAAVAAIDDPKKLEAFNEAWHDNRTSMNDIGARAHAYAEHIRDFGSDTGDAG